MGYTLTIIGCGVMGQAILSSIYNAPRADDDLRKYYPSKIITCNHSASTAVSITKMIKGFGASPNEIEVVATYKNNLKAVSEAKVVVLGTKPYLVEQMLEEIQPVLENKILVSLAAGWSISKLEAYTKKVSRVMTNTPAKYGYGTAVISHSAAITSADRKLMNQIFGHLGLCIMLPEKNMDAATALVGSGPAFVLLMLESLMESGLKMGIPLKESRECAIKVIEGTAKMVGETGQHPSVLKHQICTPGGTTIAGLCKMEEKGVKAGIINGVEEAAHVAERLGRKL
ncbi:pyrroline-5-carboxylate reductase Ecym_7197 [Eremothecium cymbalariae DBVPG|uniref:Pyrroline-5-carboxylate reductase n=1 Tax=Eremothecium cymbalariae (strain CBS 270.75 / DBVPG 7215 / KCTC 17166 / NRRL Y-17582) TaxID=931890 RepID=G8JW30_ERECY|nr:hypothetical protein Ecym_7197 [Eremothecium cymbalariae DBVPG\